MITIPEGVYFSPNFRKLVQFFNDLENRLSYPNCSGKADQILELQAAETTLKKQGKIQNL